MRCVGVAFAAGVSPHLNRYVTPTTQGSRSGAIIAQAWATLLSVGDAGYAKMASETDGLMKRVAACVAAIPELDLLVKPDAAITPIVAAPGSGVDIYGVASFLEQKGWNMFTGQHPAVMSVCLGENHLRVLDDW